MFVDESSLETNSAPVSKSLRSKDKTSLQQTIAVEENADKIVAKPTGKQQNNHYLLNSDLHVDVSTRLTE